MKNIGTLEVKKFRVEVVFIYISKKNFNIDQYY